MKVTLDDHNVEEDYRDSSTVEIHIGQVNVTLELTLKDLLGLIEGLQANSEEGA